MAQNKKRCLNCGHEVGYYDSIGEGVYKCPACGAETNAKRLGDQDTGNFINYRTGTSTGDN